MKSNETVSDNIHWEQALHLVDNLHLIENFIGSPLVWDFSSISDVWMLLTDSPRHITQSTGPPPGVWRYLNHSQRTQEARRLPADSVWSGRPKTGAASVRKTHPIIEVQLSIPRDGKALIPVPIKTFLLPSPLCPKFRLFGNLEMTIRFFYWPKWSWNCQNSPSE